MKWLSRGTPSQQSFAPFTLLYVVPLLFDLQIPNLLSRGSTICLVILPLTFSWAIVRYRLMDVDLIFKRGVTYTLATAALVGVYFGAVGITVRSRITPALSQPRLLGTRCHHRLTGLVFDPLKRGIQARVDRIFDQKRFDYRETLVEFGRSLNSQTDLRALVDSIVERLPQTLLVTRVAVFLATEERPRRHAQTSSSPPPMASPTSSQPSSGPRPRLLRLRPPGAPTTISSSRIPSSMLRLPEAQSQQRQAASISTTTSRVASPTARGPALAP